MGNLHQRILETDAHLLPVVPPPPLGEVDLWELHSLNYSHQIPCSSIRSFLFYSYSPRTYSVKAPSKAPFGRGTEGYVRFELEGPVTDDGGRLTLRYTVVRSEVRRALTEIEREAFSKKLREFIENPSPILYILTLPKE